MCSTRNERLVVVLVSDNILSEYKELKIVVFYFEMLAIKPKWSAPYLNGNHFLSVLYYKQ